ncbi:MAG: valine--tRNA ligase [Deltaproteobacteria bacterium]|nr:MAG: valine--tRNA ligase [Deltaproteobacteria bacterium]
MSARELPSEYDPHAAAERWSKAWEEAELFTPSPADEGEPFSIVIPPPNVTGALHMGHALNNTLQDVLVRYKRMAGFNALWIPGMDHAGIATQKVVRDRLAARGVDWRALGREGFVDEVWLWKSESGGMISKQLRRLGVSCDWSRERFTLDEGLQAAVIEHFVRLYEQGLVYRAERLINWDPVDGTALSDLEVDSVERQGELFSFAYPLVEGDGEIVVATTRPETMLGDTAVAVHPDDERYRHLIGQKVRHPFVDREIPILADPILVDPAFGTGCVKITPAHDFNDFEVGQRHDLPMINILERDGRLNEQGGPFAGLDRFEAREQVKARLAELGLARGVKEHPLKLPIAQRSGAVVEPMLSTQWFVSMRPLAGPALAAVEHGFTNFVPKQWENTYFAWLRDIRDWCISRQLWWGHRIPAWYDEQGKVYVARTFEQACEQAGHDRLTQDEDVLDTWFSSALWPFSTMGWPERTEDLERWYPTSVLITGFDIIFFWVARMMFAGLHFTGSVPFSDVYIHALVRDEKGDKMSKSKGNVVDPLVAVDRSGADAFRFTMVALAAQGRDILWNEQRVEVSGRFIHKMWQALRFCFLTGEGYDPSAPVELGPYEHWIAARTGAAVGRVREALDGYRFNEAASEIHAFVWGEFCDWYLELSKTTLYDDQASEARKNGTRHTLFLTMGAIARLVHPIMPFLSEEIWSLLPGTQGLVAAAAYPEVTDYPVDQAALEAVAELQAIITEVRRIRGEMQIARKVPLTVLVDDRGMVERLAPHADGLAHLVNATVELMQGRPTAVATAVAGGVELAIPLEGVIDLDEERQRLDKELAKVDKDVADLQKRLANKGFTDRAPADVVQGFRDKLDAAVGRQQALRASRERLGGA